MSVVGTDAIKARSSMLNQSAVMEKPLMAFGDHTAPMVQLRDCEGSSFELEPVCERYCRLPVCTPSEAPLPSKRVILIELVKPTLNGPWSWNSVGATNDSEYVPRSCS